MRPHYLQRLSDMKSQVVRAERESSLLLEAAEVLEKEAIQHSNERDSAREWSTVVDISIHPSSFKPVSWSLSRSPLYQNTQTSLF